MNTKEIEDEIASCFKNVPYPEYYDFEAAKSDFDYREKLNQQRRPWISIESSELKKYGEIIHFFDNAGAKYYLPAYLVNILRHQELTEMACFESIQNYLLEVSVSKYTSEQRSVICLFLIYCKERIFPERNLDPEELNNIIEKWLDDSS